jgi:membrane-bound inhibitor of C-type lysozyme
VGRMRKVIIIIFIIGVVVVGGAFTYRFYREQTRVPDAQAIQGEWLVKDTSVTMVIDSDTIHLPDDASYSYTINDNTDTITYTVTGHTGSASYVFSEDEETLTLTEGTSASLGTSSSGGTTTVLTKVSGSTLASPTANATVAGS